MFDDLVGTSIVPKNGVPYGDAGGIDEPAAVSLRCGDDALDRFATLLRSLADRRCDRLPYAILALF